MPLLLETDDAPGHKHYAYVNEQTGVGVTSLSDGHVHPVTFDPETQDWMVEFATKSEQEGAHAHILRPVEASKKKDMSLEDEKTDEDVLSNLYELFRIWTAEEEQSVKDAHEAQEFAWGIQWDSSEKELLEDQGRAALTMNSMERMIDRLTGLQRQERTDLRYLPQEGGDQRVADTLNHVTKFILEKTYYGREESKVFEDMVIPGRGVFNVWVDFQNNVEGDVKVERFPWDEIVFAPHEKEDLADCEGLIKHKMYSRARLKSLYPEHAEDIDAVFFSYAQTGRAETIDRPQNEPAYDQAMRDSRNPLRGWEPSTGEFTNIDIARKELRLFEAWRKIYTRVHVVVNPQEGFVQVLDGWSNSEISELKTLPGLYTIERESSKIRITKAVGNILLSDEFPADLPEDDYFVVSSYARKKGSLWKGKVFGGIDAQKEINKRHSQAIDIGNQSGYGWFYDANTFAGEDNKNERDFEERVGQPNFKIKVADVNQPPLRVQGVDFPSEIVRLMEMSERSLQMGLAMELPPGGANESGSHLLERKKTNSSINEFLFDNLSFAKKKLGYLLVRVIQKYFTPERMIRILGNKDMKMGQENLMIGNEPFANQKAELQQLLATSDLALYDVEVTESAYSPTVRMAMFMSLTEMARGGLPIPPEVIIEYIDVPEEVKQKALASIRAAQQAQAATAEATHKTEIEKTLIAQGQIPPQIAQQYGLNGSQPQPPQQAPAQAGPPPASNVLT